MTGNKNNDLLNVRFISRYFNYLNLSLFPEHPKILNKIDIKNSLGKGEQSKVCTVTLRNVFFFDFAKSRKICKTENFNQCTSTFHVFMLCFLAFVAKNPNSWSLLVV